MQKSNRKAKVTEDHKKESARLKQIWLNASHGLSQEAFGAKYEIGSQSVVNQFLNGVIPISLNAAIKFAEALDCQISDFSIRLAKEAMKHAEAVKKEAPDQFDEVKALNVEVSAGGGSAAIDVVEEQGSLHFKRTFMSEIGVHKNNAAIVRVRGQSMEPTIADGAVILINMTDISPKNGNVYAFVHGDMLLVKRFFFEDGLWIARSDNVNKKQFQDIRIDNTIPCRILGRALWVGMML